MRLTIASWRGVLRFVVVFVVAIAIAPVASTISTPKLKGGRRKEQAMALALKPNGNWSVTTKLAYFSVLTSSRVISSLGYIKSRAIGL
jgi:hypothetical protein